MAEKEPSIDLEHDSDSSQETPSSRTPNLWMLKWLQLHHQSLLDGMQNVVPLILDSLVDQGRIDPLRSDVYQEIMLDTTAPLQKARKLLDWLTTQPPTTFWSFQRAIRQDRLRTEAVHRLAVSDKEVRELTEYVKCMSLPDKLTLMSCDSVLKAREELQKFYRSRDKLLMSAGLAKGRAMPVEKIMVNVCLLSSEEAKKAFCSTSFCSDSDRERSQYIFSKILQAHPKLVTLEEVFKAKQEGEQDPDKVVASGGAGCGKSVCFTRKAPYEWAHGRLWQHFALLFCLELRDKSVWKAKSLPELLRLAQLGLSAEEQEEVRLFITNHPDKVVIVCDGLDEGSADESSLLWGVLQGNCVGVPSNLRIAVTTRPCSAACSLSQSISYRGVEVVGFTEEDVVLFARKYLGEESSRKLLSVLNKQPPVAGMMHVPLFCLLICDLFQEEHELPSRPTEIFEKIVLAVLRQYAKVKGLKTSFRDVTHAPARLLELVLSLGKVAYQGLLEKQMYFTDVELDEGGVPEEALELGLLSKSESTNFWKPDEYTFSHLTIQEFLAALYVSREVLQTDADMAKLLEKVSFLDGHLSTFWVFLAGVLEGNMVDVLMESLSTAITTGGFPCDEDHTITLLMYRCFAESHLGRSGSPSASVGSIVKRSWQFMGQVISAAHCSAITTVLKIHRERENVHWVGFCGSAILDYRLAQLLPGLQLCPSLKEVDLAQHDLSSQHMSALGAAFANSAGTLECVR